MLLYDDDGKRKIKNRIQKANDMRTGFDYTIIPAAELSDEKEKITKSFSLKIHIYEKEKKCRVNCCTEILRA